MRAVIAGYVSIGRRHLGHLRRLVTVPHSGGNGREVQPPEAAAGSHPDIALVYNPSLQHLLIARRPAEMAAW